MKHQPDDLNSPLRRPVESAAESGSSRRAVYLGMTADRNLRSVALIGGIGNCAGAVVRAVALPGWQGRRRAGLRKQAARGGVSRVSSAAGVSIRKDLWLYFSKT